MTASGPASLLATRWEALRGEIAAAAERGGRDPERVTVVAVTKSAPPAVFEHARAAGISDVGENRIQDALRRMVGHEDRFRWHFVGPLQANKARKAVAAFDVLHGIDSVDLLRRVDRVAAELGRTPEVLLQVNVSGETSKHGLPPDDLGAALEAAEDLAAARLVGLMTMAPRAEDPEDARPVFAGLAALREAHGGPARLPQLSMGMSGDFAVAVEEGATLVRIGRRLVDALD